MFSFIKELIKKSLFVGLSLAFFIIAIFVFLMLVQYSYDIYSKYFSSTYDKFLKTKKELCSLERQLEVEGYLLFWDLKMSIQIINMIILKADINVIWKKKKNIKEQLQIILN